MINKEKYWDLNCIGHITGKDYHDLIRNMEYREVFDIDKVKKIRVKVKSDPAFIINQIRVVLNEKLRPHNNASVALSITDRVLKRIDNLRDSTEPVDLCCYVYYGAIEFVKRESKE